MIAATALTRLRVCAGSSDHSLLVDGISTNIPDIMCKRVSEISDEKELYSLWSLEEFNEILKAPVRTKMPSFDKVMHWLKTLIFTYLRFIKAVASDQHNYANNIKMIKGVHQLTLRPNTLISLVDHFTIFNGWKDGWTDP